MPSERHDIGAYVIRDWGPIHPTWVADHAERLRETLGYPPRHLGRAPSSAVAL
ncbi:helix-turn-helix domain-containing protein [Halomonas sp. CS7]|uniref:Helix-turn-helix domain-containing protein n=1 Tax=Halomonas pelophila TaxID=3151122 RepID=A0ABV1N8N2_9GAMM